jgi:hypothetical protein
VTSAPPKEPTVPVAALPAIGTIFVAVDEPTVAMRHISKDVLLHRSN